MAAANKIVDPKACSLAEAEKWLGVSRQTLAKWLDRGAPCVQRPEGRGKPALVSVPDLHAWKLKTEVDEAVKQTRADFEEDYDPSNPDRMTKDEADRRFAVARALREEGKALEEFGMVVKVQYAADAVARRLSSVRQVLLRLYREAPELLMRKTGITVQVSTPVLREILDDAMEEMNKVIDFGEPENKDIETDDDAAAIQA